MSARIELIDPGAPGVDITLLGALAAAESRRQVVVIGDDDAARMMTDMGFHVLDRVAAAPGEVGIASWLVGRRVRRILEGVSDPGRTTVGTWSESGLSAALFAGLPASGIDAVVVAAGGPPVRPGAASRLVGATPWNEVEVRPVGRSVAESLSHRGWRTGPVIDPMEFMFAIPARERVLHRPDDSRFVVGLFASPPSMADADFASQAMISLVAAGCACEMVISSHARGADAAARWIASMTETIKGVSFGLRVDDRIDLPGALASEVDVVMSTAPLHPGDSPSALALRGWLASGVPAIVPQEPALVGLVQDGVDARVVAPHDRNAVVRAMLRLAEHRDLRNEMGHAAAARHAGRVRRSSLQVPAQGSGSFAAKSRAASR